MAHRIGKFDVVESTSETWHGLETRKEAITLADCWLSRWDIAPLELVRKDNGETAPFTTLVCNDEQGLYIGKPYNPLTFCPVNNAEFLQLVQDSISGTDHKIVTCGSIRDRARIFLSIELTGMESFTAAGKKFSAYLNFFNGHDKSSVLGVTTSNTRIVCDNTFTMNLLQVENKEAKPDQGTDDLAISTRHTKNVKMRLPALSMLIDKAVGVQGKFIAEMNKIAEETVTAKNAVNFYRGFVLGGDAKKLTTRSNNMADALGNLFANGRGNNGQTWADVFNGGTEYYTHQSSGGVENHALRQYLSSEFGTGATRKADLFAAITTPKLRVTNIERGEKAFADFETASN